MIGARVHFKNIIALNNLKMIKMLIILFVCSNEQNNS